MKKILSTIFILAFISVILTGCQDRSNLTAPAPVSPKSGTADFTRFVTIGNSITAGYQSSALFQDAQEWSFGNQIAKLVNTNYAIPFISNPGIGGQYQVRSLSPDLVLVQQPSTGLPTNLTYAYPYNNLGIPGALLYDVLNATSSINCASALAGGGPNPFFDIVLRGQGSQFHQTKLLQPTLVTCWIGNNDVLGFATSGGAKPTAPTPAATFGALYGMLGDSLASLGAKVVVANIPEVTTIPFFTTVGPLLSQEIPWSSLATMGSPGFCYQKHGVTLPNPASFATQSDLAGLKVLITLAGQSYAGLLGTATGKWYRDNHYPGIPAGIDTTKPFGFDPRNPWPDALILDADEIVTAATATAAFNTQIANVATAKGFGLVDIHTIFNSIFFDSIYKGAYTYTGVQFTAFFISGGLFSLDGVHPSSQGQGLIADEFIKVINTKFGSNYPLIQLATIPGSLNFGKKAFPKNFTFDVYDWNTAGL
jgi:hypothetical protein